MTHPDHLTIIGGLTEAETRLKAARKRLTVLITLMVNQPEAVTPADLESARDAALERLREATCAVEGVKS